MLILTWRVPLFPLAFPSIAFGVYDTAASAWANGFVDLSAVRLAVADFRLLALVLPLFLTCRAFLGLLGSTFFRLRELSSVLLGDSGWVVLDFIFFGGVCTLSPVVLAIKRYCAESLYGRALSVWLSFDKVSAFWIGYY